MNHRLMRIASVLRIALVATTVLASSMASAQGPAPAPPESAAATATEPRDPPPPLPPEVLKDEKRIGEGNALWKEQCAHCHGSRAYPGKAPKLTPRRYKPEFVWDRIHNGFKDMPAWKELYTPEQVIALVAYVLSDEFWP